MPQRARSRSRRRGQGRLLPLAALAVLACRAAPPPSVTDLVELLPTASIGSETTRVDFGIPEARAWLLDGWGDDAQAADGQRFVWSREESARLRLLVGEPRDLELRLLCWPGSAGSAPQRLGVALAGQPVGEVALRPQPTWYGVTLPGALLVPGDNTIELRLGGAAEGPAGALALERLEVANAMPGDLPEVRRDARGPALRLPAHAFAAFHVMAPAGGVLRIGAVEAWAPAPGAAPAARLEVRLRVAGQAADRVVLLAPGEGRSVDLPAAGGAPVRIVLRAALDAPASAAPGGLDLREPRLELPAPPARVPAAPAAAALPNIVFYVIDTLRADHLGAWGYAASTSPNIDAFARDATQFRFALAQASWTRPAVASLLTGLNPQSHGVRGRDAALPAGVVTLPQMLHELGYRTFAVVTNGNLSEAFGFGRGFDRFRYLHEGVNRREVHQLSDRVNAVAFPWLAAAARQAPFFLYLHTTDPHMPYTPRAPWRERFAPRVTPGLGAEADAVATLSALYDGEVAFNDASFGALLAKLRELDLYDSTVVVLVSDHGEAFKEHGVLGHGTTLHGEETRVPLIIKLPHGRGRGRVVTELARQIDVVPTLLELLGREPPPGLQGRSLLAQIDGAPAPLVVAYSQLDRRRGSWESAVVGPRKLIRTRGRSGGERLWLYDLVADPGERRNLVADEPVWRGYLLSQLAALERLPLAAGEAAPATIDPELRARLHALGYL